METNKPDSNQSVDSGWGCLGILAVLCFVVPGIGFLIDLMIGGDSFIKELSYKDSSANDTFTTLRFIFFGLVILCVLVGINSIYNNSNKDNK